MAVSDGSRTIAPSAIVGDATLYQADCRDVLRGLADNSIDSVVTDPPYALVSIVKRFGKPGRAPAKDVYGRASAGFMGKTWDTGEVAFSDEFWAEVLRVLKPGGHVVAFSGTRTYHRMAVAIEDAGFEIRDQLGWLYGCLDEQSVAVTQHGVMPYHKIKKGDLVLAYDATHMSYQWEPVEEVFAYEIDDTVYRISTDFGDQVVSRNHRCIVERGGKEAFVFAEEAAREREIRLPVLEDLRALLDAFPDYHAGAGGAEQNVLKDLRECNHRQEGVGNGQARGNASGQNAGDMHCLRDVILAEHEACPQGGEPGVQLRVQRSVAGRGVEGARTYRQGELDAGVGSGPCGEDDGRDEPIVEGRGYIQESEGQLRIGSLRALPGQFSPDVAQGRVCNGASPECSNGDWPPSDAGRVCASYRPRSAEQQFEEPDAVRDKQGPQIVRAWRGHKTIVGRIGPERYRGVIWCVRVKSGAFVAVRNGFAFPTGNSGFPKSHNQHDEWEGWGTALKPAWEPIALARKPLDGTVAANLAKWGVGALNIDGCRVESGEDYTSLKVIQGGNHRHDVGLTEKTRHAEFVPATGRWPANIVHDGSDEVVAAFPESAGAQGVVRGTEGSETGQNGIYGRFARVASVPLRNDSGSAARFFYCAKASRKDRDEGLEGFEQKRTGGMSATADGSMLTGSGNERTTTRANTHPTVKPTALMQWLCRLITPPGGVILDPFMGSGSTGKAALLEGFRFIGCEREDEYMPIAEARIAAALRREPQQAVNDNQLGMFDAAA